MSNDTYLVPDLKKGEIHRTELTIKKSRFITSIARTHGVDEAKAFIDKVTNEFMDARHNCFAFNADKFFSVNPAVASYGTPILVIICSRDA